jgi:DNA repair protein RecO (recombination protein O)
MELIRSDAIVLRCWKHSESSRIIAFFTEVEGRISLMAKGARKARHYVPFDTLSLMNIIYRKKRTREVQILTSAEPLDLFMNIRGNLEKLCYGYAICELILKTTEVEDPNPQIFQTMKMVLNSLNHSGSNYINFFWYFQLQLLQGLGFGLNLDKCPGCGRDIGEISKGKFRFSIEVGTLSCPSCSETHKEGEQMHTDTVKTLCYLSNHNLEQIGRLKPSINAGKEIERSLLKYFNWHLETGGWLHSRSFFKKLHHPSGTISINGGFAIKRAMAVS